jgi:hypothetical protein
MNLEAERIRACRLVPELALRSLDEAHEFLRDRGVLTVTPCCSLPSLHAACHEEPYRPGGRGFAAYPRTKYVWGFQLAARDDVHALKLHRGKAVLMTSEVAALAGPLCSTELAHAEAGEHGEEARRIVEHLRDAGPSELDDLKTELGLDAKTLADVRRRLERVGAVVSRPIVLEPHAHTSILERWDQRFAPSAGGIDDLLAAFVRAAVVAPERELSTWLSWPLPPGTVDRLVDEGRLTCSPEGISGATARRTTASVRP